MLERAGWTPVLDPSAHPATESVPSGTREDPEAAVIHFYTPGPMRPPLWSRGRLDLSAR